MRLGLASLGLCALLAVAMPAHADPILHASGGVLVPTAGFPPVFGMFNACDPSHPLQGVGGYSIKVPAVARAHTYTLRSDSARNDLDLVWLRGPQGPSCVGLGYDGTSTGQVQTGTVPSNADWAYVVMYLGANATFTFEVA